MKGRWATPATLAMIAALFALPGCMRGARPAVASKAAASGAPEAPAGDPTEPAPAKTLFSAKAVASLFSYPRELVASDAEVGPEWGQKGKIVWAIAFSAADDSFAPLTMILFENHYRGLTISDNQKDLLRRSGLFKDLSFGPQRLGYAMRAGGEEGGADETALLPSPRGHYELLLLVSVPKDGPKEAPGSEAYRALLMEFTVRLMDGVTRGLDGIWAGKKPI